jgi:diguanylate cyclase (GGDEF)-like protein
MEKESLTVLIADQSPAVRASLAVTLARMGHKPVLADGGLAAIRAYEKQRPDVALIDVSMQDADGYEVARAMREGDPGEWVPIVFMAGLQDEASLERGIEAGGDDYLVKPISRVMLAAKLRSIQRAATLRQRLIVLSGELMAANRQLANAAGEDTVTRLPNKRAFEQRLAQELARARRGRDPVTVMIIEIDFFGRYVDYFGREQSNETLRLVANTLRSQCKRGGDLVARYDDDRIAMILPNTQAQGAVVFGAILQRAANALALNHPKSDIASHVTLSAGITTCVPDNDSSNESLVMRAEEALFTARETGRNRFFSFEAHAEPDGSGLAVQTVITPLPAMRNMAGVSDLPNKDRRGKVSIFDPPDATVPALPTIMF